MFNLARPFAALIGELLRASPALIPAYAFLLGALHGLPNHNPGANMARVETLIQALAILGAIEVQLTARLLRRWLRS